MDDWQPVRRTSTRASIWLKKSRHQKRSGCDPRFACGHLARNLLASDEVGLSRAQQSQNLSDTRAICIIEHLYGDSILPSNCTPGDITRVTSERSKGPPVVRGCEFGPTAQHVQSILTGKREQPSPIGRMVVRTAPLGAVAEISENL